jgi:hypothetical protein
MSIFRNKKYWIIGTLTSFLGIFLVRVLAPLSNTDAKQYFNIGGYLLALGGLVIITFGTRKR